MYKYFRNHKPVHKIYTKWLLEESPGKVWLRIGTVGGLLCTLAQDRDSWRALVHAGSG
jgi:hypothetical protein